MGGVQTADRAKVEVPAVPPRPGHSIALLSDPNGSCRAAPPCTTTAWGAMPPPTSGFGSGA
jgi:hypothetical protein